MSPEQARGDSRDIDLGPTSTRSASSSTSCVSGTLPYNTRGMSVVQAIRDHLRGAAASRSTSTPTSQTIVAQGAREGAGRPLPERGGARRGRGAVPREPADPRAPAEHDLPPQEARRAAPRDGGGGGRDRGAPRGAGRDDGRAGRARAEESATARRPRPRRRARSTRSSSTRSAPPTRGRRARATCRCSTRCARRRTKAETSLARPAARRGVGAADDRDDVLEPRGVPRGREGAADVARPARQGRGPEERRGRGVASALSQMYSPRRRSSPRRETYAREALEIVRGIHGAEERRGRARRCTTSRRAVSGGGKPTGGEGDRPRRCSAIVRGRPRRGRRKSATRPRRSRPTLSSSSIHGPPPPTRTTRRTLAPDPRAPGAR